MSIIQSRRRKILFTPVDIVISTVIVGVSIEMPIKTIIAETIVTHYCQPCDVKIIVDRHKFLDNCPFCNEPIKMSGVET